MIKKNLIIKLLGVLFFIAGIILNINMFLKEAWATYYFILICLLGIVLVLMSFFAKSLSYFIQIIIGLISIIIVLYLLL